jgi:hypothetical protein
MNERILELAEQAGLEYNFDPMTWLKYEKFAESIVRECIDTVLDSSVEYATRPQIAEELKEHFGVE